MGTFLTDNLAEVLIALGLLLIALEVIALSFASFFLLFIGLALISCGGLIFVEVISPSLGNILGASVAFSVLYALLLWQPLKRLQQHQPSQRVRSDFDGVRFYCQDEIDDRGLTSYRYSGVEWQLKSEQLIAAGTEVEVVRVEVGVFWVKVVGCK